MGSQVTHAVIAIVTSILGLSILAVILSKQANTTSIISAVSSGLANDIKAATGPVTGSASGFTLPSVSAN